MADEDDGSGRSWRGFGLGAIRKGVGALKHVGSAALEALHDEDGEQADFEQEASEYKKALVQFQMDQINVTREYQQLIAEKDAELASLRGDAPPAPRSDPASARRGSAQGSI